MCRSTNSCVMGEGGVGGTGQPSVPLLLGAVGGILTETGPQYPEQQRLETLISCLPSSGGEWQPVPCLSPSNSMVFHAGSGVHNAAWKCCHTLWAWGKEMRKWEFSFDGLNLTNSKMGFVPLYLIDFLVLY